MTVVDKTRETRRADGGGGAQAGRRVLIAGALPALFLAAAHSTWRAVPGFPALWADPRGEIRNACRPPARPDEKGPEGLDSDELALRRMLQSAVEDIEPSDGTLDPTASRANESSNTLPPQDPASVFDM
ncbi:hypothetical protein ABT124_10700 [Streptomyces sp. NPDC001982]|uniref:hypothetical protein n=1 Tax=unclassified Streptomyces TaxID=2593676 RepID=UPI00331C0563